MVRGDRREDLLAAAEQVIDEAGVAGLTIDRVAARAGVAKGTVYLYFDSKEQLLGALKSRCIEQMSALVIEYLQRVESGDWWGTADAVVEAVVDFDLSHRSIIAVMATESGDDDSREVYQAATQQMLDVMTAAMRQGVAEGAFEVEDPETTALLLHFALEGALHHAILYERDLDRDRFVSAAKTLIHRALGRG